MLSPLSVAEFWRKEPARLGPAWRSLRLASSLCRSPNSRDFSRNGKGMGILRPRETISVPPVLPTPVSAMLSARRLPVTPPTGFFGNGGGSFVSSWEGVVVVEKGTEWVMTSDRCGCGAFARIGQRTPNTHIQYQGSHAEEEGRPCHYNADGKGKTKRREIYMLVTDSKVWIIQKEQNV